MVKLCRFTAFQNRSRRRKLNKVQKMSQPCASLLLFLCFSFTATLSSGKFQDYRKLLYEIFVLKGSSYFWYQRCRYYHKRRAHYFRVRATITCFLNECLFWRIVAKRSFQMFGLLQAQDYEPCIGPGRNNALRSEIFWKTTFRAKRKS